MAYFINQHIPEHYAVEKKEINDRVGQIRVVNAPKPKDQQVKYEVKNKVHVNNEAVHKHVLPPKLGDIISMDKIEHDEMEHRSLFSSATGSENISTF